MKKSLLFFALTCVFAALPIVSAHSLEAEILSVTGKVEVQKGETWQALSVGDKISSGAVVSTGFKSEVTVKVNDSVFTLGALTRMTVEKMVSTSNSDNTQIYLDSGSVTAKVNHPEDRRVGFKVSSPVATASVRGTDFYASASGEVRTTDGLVSKGPAESSSPQVSTEQDTVTEQTEAPKTEAVSDASSSDTKSDSTQNEVPPQEESKATTPASEIAGTYGIPVYAGQSSTSDSVTGTSVPPQTKHANDSQAIGGGTTSLAGLESKSTAATTAAVSTVNATIPASSTGPVQRTTGTLVISVKIPE